MVEFWLKMWEGLINPYGGSRRLVLTLQLIVSIMVYFGFFFLLLYHLTNIKLSIPAEKNPKKIEKHEETENGQARGAQDRPCILE